MTRTSDRYSFSRARRLDGPHAFASVFAFKCSAAGEYFQVYARPNREGAARLGVTVNKRFIPLAVARNYSKRLAREAFRSCHGELTGADFVVRARKSVPRQHSVEARAEIVKLMHRTKQGCAKDKAAALDR